MPTGRHFDPVREAVAIVDAVHGDGALPRLAVQLTSSTVEAAAYLWDARTGQPLALNVSRRAPHPHLSMLHEVGHFLDQQALGAGGRFGSESDRIPEVMRAIDDTVAVRRLVGLRARRQVLIQVRPSRRERFTLDQALISYLLEPKELFARAYAQYVAVRSADVRLVTQLEATRRDLFLGMVYHQQWDEEDFASVLVAFDRMLWRRRWIE